MFAIIDTETSGGKYNEEKIIEIGILIFDGNHITKTFQSLINPQKKVDFFVQKLTGIKDKDLKNCKIFKDYAGVIKKPYLFSSLDIFTCIKIFVLMLFLEDTLSM